MPFGFLLPLIFKDSRSFWKTVSAGAVLSLTIELSQLLNYRTTDVDDLMANTCGACIGYLVWHAFTKIAGERLFAAEERKREALRYVFLAMAGVFFLYRPLSVINRMMWLKNYTQSIEWYIIQFSENSIILRKMYFNRLAIKCWYFLCKLYIFAKYKNGRKNRKQNNDWNFGWKIGIVIGLTIFKCKKNLCVIVIMLNSVSI